MATGSHKNCRKNLDWFSSDLLITPLYLIWRKFPTYINDSEVGRFVYGYLSIWLAIFFKNVQLALKYSSDLGNPDESVRYR